MQGVITNGDVVRHAFTIVRLWGPGLYARCLLAVASGRKVTFLDVLSEARAVTPVSMPGGLDEEHA